MARPSINQNTIHNETQRFTTLTSDRSEPKAVEFEVELKFKLAIEMLAAMAVKFGPQSYGYAIDSMDFN